jgi:hypothetical protein
VIALNSIKSKIGAVILAAVALVATAVFSSPVLAAQYYVDKTNGSANDSPNNGSSGQPWLTIGKCVTTLAAGDTCNILAGSYNERPSLTTNGTSGSRIIYNASAGVKIGGFTGSANYTTIQGFEITDQGMTTNVNPLIYLTGGTGWLIYSNNIHDNASNNPCIRFDGTITSPTVRSNSIHHCGNSRSDGSNSAISIFQTAVTQVLIENNSISYIGDGISGGGTNKLVIRNNTFGPIVGNSSYHVDPFQCQGTDSFPELYTLFEGNRIEHESGTDAHMFFCNGFLNRNQIVRYNSTYDTPANGGIDCRQEETSGGPYATSVPLCYIYNNSWVNNAFALGNAPYFNVGSSNNFARNNLFVNVTNTSTNPYAGPIDKDYDLWWAGTGQQADPSETHALNADPLLTNATNGDFHLLAGSPAATSGGPLTTASGSGSSSTSLVVNDASWFQDGWSGITADCIAVGTASNTACISSINYSTNTITLSSPLIWTNGASVWLYRKSDGVVVLTGNAPYAGAFGTPVASSFRITISD